ncbi:MAG: hypothetical protein ACYTG5_22110 [Planctomycetota bacterium]|jgi:hypothetical protein
MRKSALFLFLCLVACSTPSDPLAEENAARSTVFIDVDGDGLPDRAAAEGEFIDRDGDGLPDQRVTKDSAFVDTDGDGIPDRRVEKR